MPPKRWAKPGKALSRGDPEAALVEYICAEIMGNNCLGLEEEEIRGMARELAYSRSREEVFEWANTLMMGEAFAAEIIKRRVDYGPPFEGVEVAAVNLVTGAAALAQSSHATAAPVLPPSGPQAARGKAAATMKVSKKGKHPGVSLSRLQRGAPEAALRPGRFECGCFATIHNFRGNCANCGRIICEQEADDSCYFCGLEPSRCINYEIAVQEGKVSKAALEKNQESYEQAIAHRDTLLEYAQNRAKRTKVIDDQAASLFSPQSAWMSPVERKQHEKSLAAEERRKKVERMHRHTGAFQVHADFVGQNLPLGARESNTGKDATKTGGDDEDCEGSESGSSAGVRNLIDNTEDSGIEARAEPLPTLLQRIWYSPDGSRVDEGKTSRRDVAALEGTGGANEGFSNQRPIKRVEEVSRRVQQNYFEDDVILFSEEALAGKQAELLFSPQSLFSEEVSGSGGEDGNLEQDVAAFGTSGPARSGPPVRSNDAFSIRYAPTPQMRARDDGVCMSMHQPWASLLVAGIKTHEGRIWSTNYRGRLWIHAASAQPQDVEETEKHYAKFMSPGQSFPRHYPTRVLLGYVYITECMDVETYEKAFPPEERQEGSPFSFICAEPKMLLFPLPMEGNHKLFTLERKVLVAAKKQLGEIT